MNSRFPTPLKRGPWRYVLACALILLYAAAAMAEPLPVPKYPTGNLLQNNNFEGGDSGWRITNTKGKGLVKCGGVGQSSDCAFYFKGKKSDTVSLLKQVIKLPATTSKESVIVQGSYAQRSLSGTSCLRKTIKIVFHNANRDPLKKIGIGCGNGTLQGWLTVTNGFSFNESVVEKSIKKIVVTVKHTGIGEWYFDNPVVMLEDK